MGLAGSTYANKCAANRAAEPFWVQLVPVMVQGSFGIVLAGGLGGLAAVPGGWGPKGGAWGAGFRPEHPETSTMFFLSTIRNVSSDCNS